MTEKDRKLQKMLGDFKEREQYPSFQNLWSLAENRRRRPAAEGAWRWILGPAVGLSLVAVIMIVITTSEPNKDGGLSPLQEGSDTVLVDLDSIELPSSLLDSFLNEPEWLQEETSSETDTDGPSDTTSSTTLAAGDSFYTGTMDFLLQTEIPAWD